MTEDSDTIVDVHYNGVFTPTPLMYFDGVKAYVPYTVVNKMNFPDFIPFLEKHTNRRCRDVYYCPHEVRLYEGLHVIQNDCDFNKFLEDINEKKRLDVYVDHRDEGEADLEDDDLVSIDDVDSILEDDVKVEHVEDDEVISLKRNFNDQFLNKLCPIQNDDLVEEDHNAIRPIYPRYDHTQKWNEMKPQLGIPLRCTIFHQTGHNKATCPSKPTPAPSTAGPSQSTPTPSTPTPVVNEVPLKKAPVKRSPMKKVPLNDAGRVRKFSERITEIGLQKNVNVKDGTGCSQDKPVTLEKIRIKPGLNVNFTSVRPEPSLPFWTRPSETSYLRQIHRFFYRIVDLLFFAKLLRCRTRGGLGTLLLLHHHTSAMAARITKRDVEKHFSAEGKVEDVHLVMDPWTRDSRGFGFVSMSNIKEADRCIKYLDGSVLEGRVITVEKARRRRGRTPTPGRYLGLRSARGGRRHRSPTYSPPCSRRRRRSYSPDYSSDSDRSRSRSRRRSYSPYYYTRRGRGRSRSRSYSQGSRSSPEDGYYRRGRGSYRYRSYSPEERDYNRSRSRDSSSPEYEYSRRRRRRSYRSVSPRSVSSSPTTRRRRRSYSSSMSPVKSKRSYSSVSVSSRSRSPAAHYSISSRSRSRSGSLSSRSTASSDYTK
ncbi:unnamed protein product [Lactuca virosa]|uniref:RRM domain-containing protein n=1 Tax=Lactuca virosa TaxID=75947 RepID=A0AAU9P951_9ASTR|nr:unnamed protein product [Lactuca virosa]